jgi:hypothetical protein
MPQHFRIRSWMRKVARSPALGQTQCPVTGSLLAKGRGDLMLG